MCVIGSKTLSALCRSTRPHNRSMERKLGAQCPASLRPIGLLPQNARFGQQIAN